MLRRFLYLDQTQLDQYISQVEDGLRSSRSRRDTNTSGRSGGIDAKVAKFNLDGSREGESGTEFADTPTARFERLLRLVEGDEETFGWIDVMQPSDLEQARRGHIVNLFCDLYEPTITKFLGAGGLLDAIPLMRDLATLGGGNALTGLPGEDSLATLSAFGSAMPPLVQGEVIDMEWHVVAQLLQEHKLGEVEGEVQVVAKVIRAWGEGAWKPLPGLPVVSQMPREQRREFERKGPDESNQKLMWQEGPALELDVLAIWR